MNRLLFILILLTGVLTDIARGQQDTTLLETFTVSGARIPDGFLSMFFTAKTISADEIAEIKPANLNSLIDQISSVDIRQRGAIGVQADISILGGSFEQTLVLVNGVPFNDPQSGHHNLNLPFQVTDIEKIEILTSPGTRFFGEGAMTGAINIITKRNHKLQNAVSAKFTKGENRLNAADMSFHLRTAKWGHYVSFSEGSSDGYTENTDFRYRHIWASGYRSFENFRILINGGWNNRFFGANSFYSPLFPDQAEEVSALTGHIGLTGGEKIFWQANLHYRRHNDRFELFRFESPEWYAGHNYHRSVSKGASFRAETRWASGLTRIGVASRHEGILSNVLGYDRDTIPLKNHDAVYDKEVNRILAEMYADHTMELGRVSVSAGSLLFLFPDNKSGVYPGIDISYKVNERFGLSSGLNRSFRLPTFTDLFYSGPANKGNPELNHEEAASLIVGSQYNRNGLTLNNTLFLRDNKDLIDWVKVEGDQLWHAMNHTRIQTIGSEILVTLKPSAQTHSLQHLKIGWTWTEQIKRSSDSLISYYILDHLRNKVTMSISHSPASRLAVVIDAVYQQRAGSYSNRQGAESPYPDVFIINTSIGYEMTQSLNWNFRINNILNSRHFDFGGVILPGRWMIISLMLNTNF